MTSSERPFPEPLLKKEASPAVLGGERILEMLWKPQTPWIRGLGQSQPYSRGEFQETLWERFRGLSGIFPEFPPESHSHTGGMAQEGVYPEIGNRPQKALSNPPKGSIPTVPEGHKHRVTTPEKPRKIPRTPAEPRRDPAEPSERPHRTLSETPAEPSERQISSESLAEGCAPRMLTLRNFRIYRTRERPKEVSIEPPFGPQKAPRDSLWKGLQNHRVLSNLSHRTPLFRLPFLKPFPTRRLVSLQ